MVAVANERRLEALARVLKEGGRGAQIAPIAGGDIPIDAGVGHGFEVQVGPYAVVERLRRQIAQPLGLGEIVETEFDFIGVDVAKTQRDVGVIEKAVGFVAFIIGEALLEGQQ